MTFCDDFNQTKSAETKAARGVDFVEARAIWSDPEAVTIPAKEVEGEVRFATVGLMQGNLWAAIWTDRDCIRIISVRRASGALERAYHGK